MTVATAPRAVRTAFGRIGIRPRTRAAAVVGALLAALLVLSLVALALGDYTVPLDRVAAALVVDDGTFASRIVRDWRLPRVLAAALFGAALALSGAVFQSLTRNPLGSPDVIGFATGAYTGALVVLLVLGGSGLLVAGGALVGGLGTALVVYLLAYRGGVQGFRLIVVGIGVTAMLAAVNQWLQIRAETEVALAGAIWGAGSLGLIGWEDLLPSGIAIALLLPALAALAPALRQLELGDDAATAHGVRTERTRLGLLVVGVALVAIVTAVAGLIAFVALAAPQIARRLMGSAGEPLIGSALVGAVLLVGADAVAQHAFPAQVPTGMVTVVLGGLYLLVLLVVEGRRRVA